MMENNTESSNKRILPQSKKIKTIEDSIDIMPHLPQDVIAQILIRLPVKPLFQLKCVAKSWRHLISSPKFIKAHVECSALDPSVANHRIMLGISYDPVREDLKHNSVSCAVRDLLTDSVDSPDERNEWRSVITGSSDGLLCVSLFRYNDRTTNHVFLWNPCLKMSNKLPPLAETEKQVWSSTYGVGYDEPNDDYKVVGLFVYSPHGGYDEFECMVQIYSLKNDSWKRIEGFKGGVESLSSVVYASGKFHFVAFSKLDEDHTRCDILSLDLKDDVYGTIKQPKYDDSDISIGVLRGCITALYSCEQDYADVWILKEYGVRESWTKLVSIPYVDGPYDISLYRFCALLNGKYLLGRGSYLVVYDPEDDSFVYTGKCNIDDISSMAIYVESLVPC